MWFEDFYDVILLFKLYNLKFIWRGMWKKEVKKLLGICAIILTSLFKGFQDKDKWFLTSIFKNFMFTPNKYSHIFLKFEWCPLQFLLYLVNSSLNFMKYLCEK